MPPFESVYLKIAGGDRYGPMPMATVRQWIAEGRVPFQSILIDAATGESLFVEDHPETIAAYPTRRFGVVIGPNRTASCAFYIALLTLPTLWLVCPAAIGGCIALGFATHALREARRHPLIGGIRRARVAFLIAAVEILPALFFFAQLAYRVLRSIKL